jgi:uncharacterized protein YbbC (DUF1343 family)
MYRLFFAIFLVFLSSSKVEVGSDRLFSSDFASLIKGKKIGLVTNHTARNGHMVSTIDLIKKKGPPLKAKLVKLYAPEHGLDGKSYAGESVVDSIDSHGIPIFSLHGSTRRPTDLMLEEIDILVYDIQDLGARSYTFSTTLLYVMEEAAKKKIPVIVLDRPNPINGWVVDGPMLEDKLRSFVGYINVPYCHGMTIGELARYFNGEYKIDCDLTVVPMKGWRREMSFSDTGLSWIPSSPNIPEATTALYYPITGIVGELQIVNIGIGYTLPFRLIGAPWINGKAFADKLNAQQFPGVQFVPFYYRPFYGRYAQKDCEGVMVTVTDPLHYKPVATQYLIIGLLKTMYPKEFQEGMKSSLGRRDMFNKVNGTAEVWKLMESKGPIVWKLREIGERDKNNFLEKRKKYLIPTYLDARIHL